MLNKINLTPHFTLAEMLKTKALNGRGVELNCKSLTPAIYKNLFRVCKVLEEARALICLPIRVNSGFRCPDVNAAVSGAKDSDHLYGCAADISIRDYTQKTIAKLLAFFRDSCLVRVTLYEPVKHYIHISLYRYDS